MADRINRMYTKDDIKSLLNIWDSNSKEEICEKMNMIPAQVDYLAKMIKLAGYKLTPKRKTGATRLLVTEVLKELKLIK